MFQYFDRGISFITTQLKFRRTWIIIAIIVAIVFFVARSGNQAMVEEVATTLPQVEVRAIAELGNQSLFTTVGTIEAVSEAQLKAEGGGQITAVYTELGAPVAAGSIIAQIENSRERAAVTQAQGSYEAALAGAAQANSGVREAEIQLEQAETAYRTAVSSAYTTLSSVLTSTIDDFFSNPTSMVPGLRVSGDTASLNADRVALQTELPKLQASLATLTPQNTAMVALDTKATANRMLGMVDSLYEVVLRDGDSESLGGVSLATYAPELLAARTSLTGVVTALENAERNKASANETLDRARVSGTDTNVSLANAQIKISLGSLRAAQANYEKTLVRTPIAGVVNALYVKRGDYVSPLQDVALVANNNGLQITTAINEADRNQINIGDQVSIDAIATGTISAIAGAVDPKTGKIAVKISLDSTEGFVNGKTASVAFMSGTSSTRVTDQSIQIPLSAVKLSADGAFVFTVGEGNLLVANPVELGPVSSDQVTVLSGITRTTQIVIDARGRKAGEEVTIAQ